MIKNLSLKRDYYQFEGGAVVLYVWSTFSCIDTYLCSVIYNNIIYYCIIEQFCSIQSATLFINKQCRRGWNLQSIFLFAFRLSTPLLFTLIAKRRRVKNRTWRTFLISGRSGVLTVDYPKWCNSIMIVACLPSAQHSHDTTGRGEHRQHERQGRAARVDSGSLPGSQGRRSQITTCYIGIAMFRVRFRRVRRAIIWEKNKETPAGEEFAVLTAVCVYIVYQYHVFRLGVVVDRIGVLMYLQKHCFL